MRAVEPPTTTQHRAGPGGSPKEQHTEHSALHTARDKKDTNCQRCQIDGTFRQQVCWAPQHVYAFCNDLQLARMCNMYVQDCTRRPRWRCCPSVCIAVCTRRVWRAGCVLLSLSTCGGVPVHGKFRSLSSLSLGTLDLSIERPPFQARVACGLTLAATHCVWPLARHLI